MESGWTGIWNVALTEFLCVEIAYTLLMKHAW